ncbi:N-acetyltransferase GCN5 [Actinokineospora sp. NBRC 105648]|nr:N-acetyltransferase GCN5 [Actinokineospora sp. NBRC 105648]
MARVHVAAWRGAYAGLMSVERLADLDESRFTETWITNLAAPGEARPFVAEVAGEVAGIATVGPSRSAVEAVTGELWMLNVHPQHWGTGVAGALHDHVIGDLSDLGYARAMLWVADGNDRACAFYSRKGWAPDGEVLYDDRETPPLRELRYVRELRHDNA